VFKANIVIWGNSHFTSTKGNYSHPKV